MSELRDLYEETILDHGKRPRNRGPLPDADRHAEGYNPLCGDSVTVHVKTAGERIDEVRFEGQGCAISMASASMMSEAVRGATLEEARRLFDAFHGLVTASRTTAPAAGLGKLVAFAGVRDFPVRVKCATLAWHTLLAALDRRGDAISTE